MKKIYEVRGKITEYKDKLKRVRQDPGEAPEFTGRVCWTDEGQEIEVDFHENELTGVHINGEDVTGWLGGYLFEGAFLEEAWDAVKKEVGIYG